MAESSPGQIQLLGVGPELEVPRITQDMLLRPTREREEVCNVFALVPRMAVSTLPAT